MKRFVCTKLPRACIRSGAFAGAEAYSGVEYEWIFHHKPELKVFNNGILFNTFSLAVYDEAGLHKLWSTYFPKIQGRLLKEEVSASNTTVDA